MVWRQQGACVTSRGASCCTMQLYAHRVLSVWTVCFYALNKNGGCDSRRAVVARSLS